jgi:DNA-directed RNA polymerase subunit RPC12/RpoP
MSREQVRPVAIDYKALKMYLGSPDSHIHVCCECGHEWMGYAPNCSGVRSGASVECFECRHRRLAA